MFVLVSPSARTRANPNLSPFIPSALDPLAQTLYPRDAACVLVQLVLAPEWACALLGVSQSGAKPRLLGPRSLAAVGSARGLCCGRPTLGAAHCMWEVHLCTAAGHGTGIGVGCRRWVPCLDTVGFWNAATSKADPRQQQDWILKCLQVRPSP